MQDEKKVILKDRLQVYLSDEAKEALYELMGEDGKPSPTINETLIKYAKIKKEQ